MSLSLIFTFLGAIPDLVKLLQAIQAAQKRIETDKKVKDDLKTLHQAISSGDANAVTALFSNQPPTLPAAPTS